MPLQNRVTPFSEIVVDPARGSLMGNRGILHDGERQLTKKRWGHQQWIHCVLEFKGRQRVPMAANNYTELFFLDEASALAAGHRPCGECQREKYREFKALFEQCHQRKLSSKDMDKVLHSERLTWQSGKRTKQKRTYVAQLQSLPSFTFVADGDAAYLWLNQTLRRWSFDGYAPASAVDLNREMLVLTPRTMVEILRLGYRPNCLLSEKRVANISSGHHHD